ncbi:hypothetical protein L249_3241, partial [Ophiocordyceps polyrhachis-furcata BCC 54312]
MNGWANDDGLGEDGRATVGQEPNRPSVLGLSRTYDDDDDYDDDYDYDEACLPRKLAGVALELYDYCADRYPPHGGGEPMGLCFMRNSGRPAADRCEYCWREPGLLETGQRTSLLLAGQLLQSGFLYDSQREQTNLSRMGIVPLESSTNNSLLNIGVTEVMENQNLVRTTGGSWTCSLGDVAVESRADTAAALRLPPSADALKKADIECQYSTQAPRHHGKTKEDGSCGSEAHVWSPPHMLEAFSFPEHVHLDASHEDHTPSARVVALRWQRRKAWLSFHCDWSTRSFFALEFPYRERGGRMMRR